MKRSRPHHYMFAHKFLPVLLFSGSEASATLIAKLFGPEDSVEMCLDSLWDCAADALDPEDERIQRDGLSCTVSELPPANPTVVITLPPPVVSPEAYMVAIMLVPADSSSGRVGFELKYYTLELGMTPDNERYTVLGGWDQDGCHLNYGNVPSSDLMDFLIAIDQLNDTSDA